MTDVARSGIAEELGIAESESLAASDIRRRGAVTLGKAQRATRDRVARIERTMRSRFDEARRELEAHLGTGTSIEDSPGEATVEWRHASVCVRLVLRQLESEAPYELVLRVDGFDPAAASAAVPVCTCESPSTTLDPFQGLPWILTSNNPVLRKTLKRIGETHAGGDLARLYECRSCGALFQSGDLSGQQYVFRVPPIDVRRWVDLPYIDRSMQLNYLFAREHYLAALDRTPTDRPCRTPGCTHMAIRFSARCIDHDQDGPTPPLGRPLD